MSTRNPGPVAPMRLEEVREDEAPPGTRAIYADIKRATGIPQVNLIFRHLARDPAVLGWAWEMAGPLYRSGAVAAAAGRLEPALAVPPGPPVWQTLDQRRPDEVARLRAVLAFYDRGNRSNLVGLATLLRAAGRSVPDGRTRALPAAASPMPAPATAPAPIDLVPPLPRRDSVEPEVMALIEDLAARQGSSAIGVVPSLYLHLAHWPEAVRGAHAAISPMLGTTGWRRRVDGLIAATDGVAGELAETVGSAAPPPDGAERYLRTVRDFVAGPIPQMVLVGRILSGGVSPAAR